MEGRLFVEGRPSLTVTHGDLGHTRGLGGERLLFVSSSLRKRVTRTSATPDELAQMSNVDEFFDLVF